MIKDIKGLHPRHIDGGGCAHQQCVFHRHAGPATGQKDRELRRARRFFRRTGEGLYDMEDLARATAKMIAYVTAYRAAYPGHPVYAFGYSNGANILASAFFERPDLFERVGLLHPLVTWEPAPNPGVEGRQVLVTAGRHDPISPWARSACLMDWLETQGAEVAREIHNGGHELRNSELTALAKLFE